MANISDFITPAGTSGGGGGGGLTNTYASFHVQPLGGSPVTVTDLAGDTDEISFEIGSIGAVSVWFYLYDATTGEYAGNIGTGSFAGQDGTGARRYDAPESRNPDRLFGNFIAINSGSIVTQSSPPPFPSTIGWNIATGLYNHPEGGVYLRTGLQVLQGTTYPNATVTGSMRVLAPVRTLPEIVNPANSMAPSSNRVVFDGTRYWRFVWYDNQQVRGLRNQVPFQNNSRTQLVATPYTPSGSGVTTGTPVTLLDAGTTTGTTLSNPRGLGGGQANFSILDVAWDEFNDEFVFVVLASTERGGINATSTIRFQTLSSLTAGTAENYANAYSTRSFGGPVGFNFTGNDVSLTVDARNGNYLFAGVTYATGQAAGYYTNIRSAGPSGHFVRSTIDGGGGASPTGGAGVTRFFPEWVIVGNRVYVVATTGATLSVGASDLPETPSAAELFSAVNFRSFTARYSIPSGVTNASTFSGGLKLLPTGSNGLIVPLGSNRYLEISDVTSQTVLDGLVQGQPLVGDPTVRTVESSIGTAGQLTGLTGNLDQTVFYRIG